MAILEIDLDGDRIQHTAAQEAALPKMRFWRWS